MTHTILVFLKIGAQEHITDLYENGTVYMNSLSYFKKIRDGELRGDPTEGALSLFTSDNVVIKLKETDEGIRAENITYGYYLTTGNIFSLYSISSRGFPSPKDFVFDQKNIGFGTHCLMIKQPGVFIDRLTEALKAEGHRFKHGFVDYYEPQPRMEKLSVFDKPNTFKGQHEFRFFVESEHPDPIIVKIGSMKSYAEIFEAKDLPTLELRPGKN